MSYKYSLIVATYGRKAELELLLDSLVQQTIGVEFFEVIIVDQNVNGLLSGLIENYVSKINIKHIQSERKGLSHNRNLGISQATGAYLAFPDDDCQYYPNTLKCVDEDLQKFEMPHMIIGKVYNREERTHVFKKTPDEYMNINSWNFYSIVSSITLFFKKNDVTFNEEFGIGEKYHSNEDGVKILSFLKHRKKIIYSPRIELNHPPYDENTMSVNKIYKYGIGFGAMCRKFLSFAIAFLFFKAICYQSLMMLAAVFAANPVWIKRRWAALKGQLFGLFIYASEEPVS
jgi:glycosyltransferase involved in cell wall biosynthesis